MVNTFNPTGSHRAAPLGRQNSMRPMRSGFTLIELLVVVTILAILIGLAVPVLGGALKSTNATKAVSNLRQIALANQLYAGENGGRIVGRGNGTDWKGISTNGLGALGRLYPYVGDSALEATEQRIQDTFSELRDPNVPTNLSDPTTGATWAINSLFDQDSGGGGALGRGRLLQDFDSPSRVIYVSSGDQMITAADAEDPSMVPLPSSSRRGFYFSYKRQTPPAFLDGHAELLAFPIDPTLVDPD